MLLPHDPAQQKVYAENQRGEQGQAIAKKRSGGACFEHIHGADERRARHGQGNGPIHGFREPLVQEKAPKRRKKYGAGGNEHGRRRHRGVVQGFDP